ncbi:MAG: ATP-binding protein [Candidatus Sumerlaeota bacterium]
MSMFLNDKTGEPPRNRHISDLLRDIGVEEEQVGAYMTQLESERKVRRLPLRVKKEHRERLFLEISSAFRYNSDGKAVGIQGFLQDVTEKRISDMRILEQRWLLQAIFDNAPIGLMGIDEQGVLNNLNCMFLRNLDISGEKGETIRQEVTGMPAAKGLDRIFEACPCTSQVITALKEACVAHAESKRFEVVTATGKKALFLTAPLRRSPDGPNGLIVLSQDVTHERQLEKLRDDLTHMIVHDLKNPLSAIQGANATLKLLLADNLNASTEKALAVIGKSVGNMTRMVSNLLDISRLEQNRLPLNLEETDPAELIQEMRSELQSLADHRETRLPQKAVGRKIHLDRELIRRVIQNLFYNAVKHTDGNGRVQIRVVKKENGGVSISVIDNGEGIPPESREHIFEKFSQVQTRQRGRKTDTGLGLTFCKLAVEAHGGHIALKSEVDKGTTFIVSLPDQPPDGNA